MRIPLRALLRLAAPLLTLCLALPALATPGRTERAVTLKPHAARPAAPEVAARKAERPRLHDQRRHPVTIELEQQTITGVINKPGVVYWVSRARLPHLGHLGAVRPTDLRRLMRDAHRASF